MSDTIIFKDLVREISTTRGTGAFELRGAVAGFSGFADTLSVGDRFYYSAVNQNVPGESETGIGTLEPTGDIARSPSGGIAVDFSAGNKVISLVVGADWFSRVEADVGGGGAAVQALSDDVALLQQQIGERAALSHDHAVGEVTGLAGDLASIAARAGRIAVPEDFGAVGDGVSDDTQALRDWLASNADMHMMASGKTYSVKSTDPDGIILELTTARQIRGNGATIKIADLSGPFEAILGAAYLIDMTGLVVEGITFDHNQAGNLATFAISGTTLTQPHRTISVQAGRGIRIANCRILNARSTNSFFVNGFNVDNEERLFDVEIVDNCWEGVGGDEVATFHDHSTIYAHCDGLKVVGNRASGAALGANGTACFVEVHGRNAQVIDNRVSGFIAFCNLTGVYNSGPSSQILVANNVAEVAGIGVRFYTSAQNGQAHVGIENVRVAGNVFRIHQLVLEAGGGPSGQYVGIGGTSGTLLDIRDVSITGNRITFDAETSAPSYDYVAYALGFIGGAATTRFENIDIAANEVTNSPCAAAGFGLGDTSGIFKNCRIEKSNRFINPGQSLSPATAPYRMPIFSWVSEYRGATVLSGQVVDDHAVTRIQGGVFARAGVDCSALPIRVEIDVQMNGDKASFQRSFQNGSGTATVRPTMTAVQNKDYNHIYGDQFDVAEGSTIRNSENGVVWRYDAINRFWPSEGRADEAPTSGFHYAGSRRTRHVPSANGSEGWVCTGTGSPGTWKSFGSVSA